MSSTLGDTPPASYSTAELARRLGVSTPTVQRWVDLGHLKAWKTVGGHRRIDAESAERFMAEQGLSGLGEILPAVTQEAGLSVLVVDDNPDDRDLLSALVQSALPGATVKVVENGFQALVTVGRSTPDVLVTDIVMPHMNGLEMLRHLCGEGWQRPRAILAVSSHDPLQIASLGGLPAGVSLVGKPIDPDAFVQALQEALSPSAPQGRPPASTR